MTACNRNNIKDTLGGTKLVFSLVGRLKFDNFTSTLICVGGRPKRDNGGGIIGRLLQNSRPFILPILCVVRVCHNLEQTLGKFVKGLTITYSKEKEAMQERKGEHIQRVFLVFICSDHVFCCANEGV